MINEACSPIAIGDDKLAEHKENKLIIFKLFRTKMPRNCEENKYTGTLFLATNKFSKKAIALYLDICQKVQELG